MELEIAFLPDGSVRVRVPDGQAGVDYAAARAAVMGLQRELGLAGLPIVFEGAVERHTRGPGEVHAHTRQSAGAGY